VKSNLDILFFGFLLLLVACQSEPTNDQAHKQAFEMATEQQYTEAQEKILEEHLDKGAS